MTTIKTASWFTALPANDYLRIGISRSSPRRQPAGYRMLRALAPGAWFNSVGVEEYCTLYAAILADLNPIAIAGELQEMAGPGRTPVLLCYERAPDFCHRSLVAAWLSGAIGEAVDEVGYEGLPHPLLPRLVV